MITMQIAHVEIPRSQEKRKSLGEPSIKKKAENKRRPGELKQHKKVKQQHTKRENDIESKKQHLEQMKKKMSMEYNGGIFSFLCNILKMFNLQNIILIK